MRRGVLLTAAAVLLVGPTVLAFFSGGYFDGPRFVATIVAWALVLSHRGGRPSAVAGVHRGAARGRRAGPDHRLDRALPYVGAAVRAGHRLDGEAAPLPRRARGRRRRISGPARAARGRARPGAGSGDRDRLRARGASAAGADRARPVGEGTRPVGAADHILERRGCARGHRPGALRAPGGHAVAPARGTSARRGLLRATRDGHLPLVLARRHRGGAGGPGCAGRHSSDECAAARRDHRVRGGPGRRRSPAGCSKPLRRWTAR